MANPGCHNKVGIIAKSNSQHQKQLYYGNVEFVQ